jgi:hypothetical protein
MMVFHFLWYVKNVTLMMGITSRRRRSIIRLIESNNLTWTIESSLICNAKKQVLNQIIIFLRKR